MKYITIETPLTDYYHKNVYEVETEFMDMGFTDITKKSTQNKLGSEYNNNVKVVMIDGKQDYAVGDEVTSDSPVEIEYLGTYSTGQYTSSEPTVDGSDTTTDKSTEEKDTNSSNDTTETIQQDSSSETAETAFPSKTVNFDFETRDGYTIGVTVNLGYWVKADDTAAIAKAWSQVGGKGDPPTIENFSKGIAAGNCAMTFANAELVNKTEGFDITPNAPVPIQVDYVEPYNDEAKGVMGVSTLWQLSKGNFTRVKGNSVDMSIEKLTSNHTGPIPIAICISNVFTPKSGADGMGIMENVRLDVPYSINGYTIGGEGEKDITLPIAWPH